MFLMLSLVLGVKLGVNDVLIQHQALFFTLQLSYCPLKHDKKLYKVVHVILVVDVK